jgi:hypothetical protein
VKVIPALMKCPKNEDETFLPGCEIDDVNQKASAKSRCPRRSLINHHLMTTHRKYFVAALLPTLYKSSKVISRDGLALEQNLNTLMFTSK